MAVVNGYATVEELRNHFGDTDPDALKLPLADLERALNATSRAIEKHTARRFWRDPADALTTRTYVADDWYELDVADISTDQGLVVTTDPNADGNWSTTWSASDLQMEPLNAAVDGGAYAWTRLVAASGRTWPVHARRATVRVTARHGWSEIPAEVNEACLLRAASIFKRREAVFGVAGLNGFGEVRITRKDPDVVDLLHNFIRITVGVVG
ncbi:hypothetical protein OHB44_27990 [Micromonospora sp. NBC_00821]|uniref:hypothetical protein n=1 Tax=Micromonospora sp. NBC_00821 TaxID=2975977 RepID=UPI002ED486C7|nr:hypothetical protein OHB44_27990 [Micromonospora sp. NBC_00821]